MALVTIQILEGMERGQVFENLPTPVTIGREDDNVIRLNDERVSRFHAKIQDDGERLILTDLESTNGTRVNGHPVQIHVLNAGDLVCLGRCLLLYGSRGEIAEQQQLESSRSDADSRGTVPLAQGIDPNAEAPCQLEEMGELFPGGPPEVPRSLSLAQRAQVSDILAYMHDCIRRFMEAGREVRDETEEDDSSSYNRQMRVRWSVWQELVGLELDLAQYMRRLADPEGE